MQVSQPLDRSLIERQLRGAAQKAHITVFSSLASTNTTVKQMAAVGAPNGSVVIAERQSAGRGRMGRSFFSPDSTGLYMSVLVCRDFPAADAIRMTTAAAVATAQAIEMISGKTARIKWVNDIYIDEKKVCGILTEGSIARGTCAMAYAVVGIGVNIISPVGGFPPEIADVATSLFSEEKAVGTVRENLAAEILNRLMPLLDDLKSPVILHDYRRRSLIPGRYVWVYRGNETARRALALEVDDEFRLLVRYEDGTTEALDSGEVSIKRA